MLDGEIGEECMKYALFGAAGAVGKELAAVLAKDRHKFRVVGRNERQLKEAFGQYEPFVEYSIADLSKKEDALRAAQGIDTLFYLVGVPYHRFELHPQMSEICVNASAEAGVKQYVHLSTLYSYGLMQGDRITEDHSREPHTYKGKMRKIQEDIVLASDGKNEMRVTILCPPDFYGGDSPLSLVHRVFEGAVNGTTADVIGPIDKPHEFVYVPDLAKTLYLLSQKTAAYGKRWNLGGAGSISVQQFADLAYGKLGKKPKLRVANKFLLRLIGLKNTFMKEFVEMHYLMTKPLFVDDSNLRKSIPELEKTTYHEGIAKTLEFLSNNKVAPSRDNNMS